MECVHVVRLAGREFRVRFARDAAGGTRALVEEAGDGTSTIAVNEVGRHGLLLDGRPLEYRLVAEGEAAGRRSTSGREGELVLESGGGRWSVVVLSEAQAAAAETERARGLDGPLAVRTPMPGRVLAVEAHEGDAVEQGARLFVIEAMKMENEIRAPRGGVIRDVGVAVGDAVELDQDLCVIDAPAAREELAAHDAPAAARRATQGKGSGR